jgi:voltage-gated potassium channel
MLVEPAPSPATPRPVPPSSRARLWSVLEGDSQSALGRAVTRGVLGLIALNVTALVVGTVPAVATRYGRALFWFEAFSVAVFTLEYVARLWACGADPRYRGISGAFRWARTPMAMVDLLVVLPFYIPASGVDLRFLRLLRLFRVLRIAKLARYSEALQLLGRVLVRKRGEMAATGSVLVVLLLGASSMMYFAEHEAQPEVFSSIPASFWWAIVTLTTVGYGDVFPITAAGKAMGALVAILGIGLFALPAGILGSGFVEEIQDRDRTCPHCGEPI